MCNVYTYSTCIYMYSVHINTCMFPPSPFRYADRAKQIKTKLVPNVLNVDYHVSRYRSIVEELQKEVGGTCLLCFSRQVEFNPCLYLVLAFPSFQNSELKAKLAKECPRDTFDSNEAKR